MLLACEGAQAALGSSFCVLVVCVAALSGRGSRQGIYITRREWWRIVVDSRCGVQHCILPDIVFCVGGVRAG